MTGGLTVKENGNRKGKSIAKAVILGVSAALTVYLALLALVSLLAVRGTVSEARLGALLWGAAFLASLSGALISSGKGRETVLTGPLTAAVFWALIQRWDFWLKTRSAERERRLWRSRCCAPARSPA